MEKKYYEYFKRNSKRFMKFRDEEVFSAIKFEFSEDWLTASPERLIELYEGLMKEIRNWKVSIAMKGIKYYSPIHKMKKKFHFIQISIFAYQEECGNWKMIERHEIKEKAYIHNFDTEEEMNLHLKKIKKMDFLRFIQLKREGKIA